MQLSIDRDRIELDTINSQTIRTICADRCRAKCCRDITSDFTVPVSVKDFRRLDSIGKDHGVDFDEGMFPQLRHRADGSCVFLDRKDNLCTIHEHRPDACRSYPFKHLKEKIDEFCILYHSTSTSYRQDQRREAEIEQLSIGQHLFTSGDGMDDVVDKYMRRLNEE